MKMTAKLITALLALHASACLLNAQDNGQQLPPPDRHGPPPGEHRPPPPVIVALDLNKDGEVSKEEATESLKKQAERRQQSQPKSPQQ